jgi:integrase
MEKPKAGKRERIITVEEYGMIVGATAGAEFRDLLTVAWETGARPQELVRVEARHVDLANSRWVFPPEEAKVKKRPRIVYLSEKALEITKRLMLKHPDGPLFRNTDGVPWNKSSVSCAFGRIKKKLSVKYCLYNFRHSFATRLLEAGVDGLTVAILLGHADVSMLGRVYQHLSHNPERLLQQVRRIAG